MKKVTEITATAKSSLVALKSLRTNFLGNLAESYHPFESEANDETTAVGSDVDESIKIPLDKIVLGIEEAEFILALLEHLDVIEANTMKLNSMIMRLSEENSWLRDEITASQNRLGEAEERNIDLENQIKDYKLKLELVKYEEPMSKSYSSNQLSESINLTESTISGQFTEEACFDTKKMMIGKQVNNSSQSKMGQSDMSGSNVSNTSGSNFSSYNYELPEHLKTLHSLITEYSSNGRYEVATALCKQAIQNEMNSISSKKKILEVGDEPDEVTQQKSITESGGQKMNGSTMTTAANGDLEYCSLDIATLQNILALVYRDQGNYNQAVELLNSSLAIREKLLGANHPLIAITLNNISILQARTAKLTEAENTCKRALAIREQHFGNSHPEVAKQLFNLALLVQNQGRYEEVEKIYKKALSIYADNYGPDNISVIKTRNNIAYVHLKQNNFVQAEIIFKELLTCWHERLMGQHQQQQQQQQQLQDGSTGDNLQTQSQSSVTVAGNGGADEMDGGSVLGPKKPLWVLVEDKNMFGSNQNLKNSAELRKLLPLYSKTIGLPKDDFDLFSSTISYLIRAYKGQHKLLEADILEDWLSRSIKQFDSNLSTTRKYRSNLISSADWSIQIKNDGCYGDEEEYYMFEPFSPNFKNTRSSAAAATACNIGSNGSYSSSSVSAQPDSYSRYSIRRIGSKISSKFKSFRSQVTTAGAEDNGSSGDLLNNFGTKGINS